MALGWAWAQWGTKQAIVLLGNVGNPNDSACTPPSWLPFPDSGQEMGYRKRAAAFIAMTASERLFVLADV